MNRISKLGERTGQGGGATAIIPKDRSNPVSRGRGKHRGGKNQPLQKAVRSKYTSERNDRPTAYREGQGYEEGVTKRKEALKEAKIGKKPAIYGKKAYESELQSEGFLNWTSKVKKVGGFLRKDLGKISWVGLDPRPACSSFDNYHLAMNGSREKAKIGGGEVTQSGIGA